MIGKEGLEEERRFVLDTWRDDGNFVLVHDPTTCLRIGDATEFKPIGTNGWEAYLHEIKKDPNRKRSQQQRRKRLAEEAIRDGGPLPNDPEARLVTLDVPYKTHLSRLRDAFRLAAERGAVGMKVPGGRTLVAADVRQGYQPWCEQEFIERTNEAQIRAFKRAGIHDVGHHVHYDSYDMTARSPIQPPDTVGHRRTRTGPSQSVFWSIPGCSSLVLLVARPAGSRIVSGVSGSLVDDVRDFPDSWTSESA
jgi:hypothetical protein